MQRTWIATATVVTLAVLGTPALTRRLRRVWRGAAGRAVIADTPDASTDNLTGAVRSVQAADIFLPRQELERMWSPMHLERLARTYWRFLSRVTLGLIRVCYTERERYVVLLVRR